MNVINTLSASINHVRGFGKCRKATEVTIKLGDLVVATHTLGGQYSLDQAKAEFKRAPERFVKGPAFSLHVLPFAV